MAKTGEPGDPDVTRGGFWSDRVDRKSVPWSWVGSVWDGDNVDPSCKWMVVFKVADYICSCEQTDSFCNPSERTEILVSSEHTW